MGMIAASDFRLFFIQSAILMLFLVNFLICRSYSTNPNFRPLMIPFRYPVSSTPIFGSATDGLEFALKMSVLKLPCFDIYDKPAVSLS
jgi:hypothetical protein